MRIIAVSTLKAYWSKNPETEQQLKSWVQEAKQANWSTSSELKAQYRNASIIDSKRVVFNINGNKNRLIVDIEYRLQIVFVLWLGTHAEYDKINVKRVKYVKTNKK
jgi:mRNA interferase HigB